MLSEGEVPAIVNNGTFIADYGWEMHHTLNLIAANQGANRKKAANVVQGNVKEGENKVRIQKFKGIIIKIAGKSLLERTITVRKKVGPFGVERIFPIHSPSIDKIEIVRQFKVRHKYIKFVKNLSGKAARLKEVRKK